MKEFWIGPMLIGVENGRIVKPVEVNARDHNDGTEIVKDISSDQSFADNLVRVDDFEELENLIKALEPGCPERVELERRYWFGE